MHASIKAPISRAAIEKAFTDAMHANMSDPAAPQQDLALIVVRRRRWSLAI
jgi:hypothetical protein